MKIRIWILMLFVVLGFHATAQQGIHGNFSDIRLINGDRNVAGSANGTIYYDIALNKFYFRQNGAWVELGGSGTGITAGDKGDITVTSGLQWFIDNGVVTNSKIASMPEARIKGRPLGAGFGETQDMTGAQVNEILPVFGSFQKGLVPAAGTPSTSNFLRADGTWAVPPGTGGTGSGTTETASNGLNKNGSDIRLGGTVFQDTDINTTLNSLRIGTGSGTAQGALHFGGGIGSGANLAGGDYIAKAADWSLFNAWTQYAQIRHENENTEYVTFEISSDPARSTTFVDGRTAKKGIQYGGPGYETQPYSLVTKSWTEQKIAEAVGNVGGITTGDKGDITVTNSGNTWTVDPSAITYSKIQNVTANRILGRVSTTGAVQELTGSQVSTMLPDYVSGSRGLVPMNNTGNNANTYLRGDGVWGTIPLTSYSNFTSTQSGLTPASGGGTTKYLRADGTWQVPPSTGGTTYGVFTRTVNGLVPAPGGSTTTRYMREDGTWATPPNTTYGLFSTSANGLTPASPGGTTAFLRADGSWATPPSGGGSTATPGGIETELQRNIGGTFAGAYMYSNYSANNMNLDLGPVGSNVLRVNIQPAVTTSSGTILGLYGRNHSVVIGNTATGTGGFSFGMSSNVVGSINVPVHTSIGNGIHDSSTGHTLNFGSVDMSNVTFFKSGTNPITGGRNVIFVGNMYSKPASTSGLDGGLLYAEGGALKWSGASNTITTMGAADPHCPVCGADFVVEYENTEKYGYFAMCMKCLGEHMQCKKPRKCKHDMSKSMTNKKGSWSTHK